MNLPPILKIFRMKIDQGILNGFKIESTGIFEVTLKFNVRSSGGIMKVISAISVYLTERNHANPQQMKLARPLERMLYTVMNRVKPSSRQEKEFHEELLNAFSSVNDNGLPVRTSEMTRREMSEYCERLVEEILNFDSGILTKYYNPADISTLFNSFHNEWFDTVDFETIKNWDYYRSKIPYCEFTFEKGNDVDPLERMHIISAGAHGEIYEEPWNWIHAKHSVHMAQHQHGWDYVLDKYPHMMKRVERAKQMEIEYVTKHH